jgi:hypothetical protein
MGVMIQGDVAIHSFIINLELPPSQNNLTHQENYPLN